MFVYKNWEEFCCRLNEMGIHSKSAYTELTEKKDGFLILKHDVETNPKKALQLAKIESKYGHAGVYYVQAYLMNNEKNIRYLQQIKRLGHEVSYHHDVMDSNGGDLHRAADEFEQNKRLFEKSGFEIKTVCQHGNPVIDRVGYTSNRDFFRNEKISEKFSDISEIMVNFRERIGIDYKYISDAGYGWKVIYDPENNDIIDSSDRDTGIENLDRVIDFIVSEKAVIVSTHPHRWNKYGFYAYMKNMFFKFVRYIAKLCSKVPFLKKIMSRFYFVAKKI